MTSLLIQNMESSSETDFFGICVKCQKKVVGENNGCTANDQVYHISCFICVNCGTLLRGKSFYSMDNKPYCEQCYVSTLEKCSVCSKAITDRLLRATGKPYHPACFTCVVCGKSLDGIPFTVDATNQIHCIEDFHKNLPLVAASVNIPSCQRQGRKRLSGWLPWIKVFMFSAIDVKIVDCCCHLRLKDEDVTLWTSISYVKTAMPRESRPCLLKWPQSYELQYFIMPEAFHGDSYLWIPH